MCTGSSSFFDCGEVDDDCGEVDDGGLMGFDTDALMLLLLLLLDDAP